MDNPIYHNPKPIAILMGTFNGEKYLESQIESLLSQTNHDWTLYIRDDGSTDNTVEIINRYTSKYENIILIKDQKGNLWCKDNFFQILEYVDSQYYMFCDQDDIWLPNKIDITFNKLKEVETQNPNQGVIVYTDLKVVDENLNVIHDSFWDSVKLVPDLINSFEYLAVYNSAWGCTMMFNKKAREISIPMPASAQMHDSYICIKVVANGGKLVSINTQTILYRQHSSNTIGTQDYNKNYLLSKVTNIKKIVKDNIAKYNTANDIKKLSVAKYLYYKLLYTLRRG